MSDILIHTHGTAESKSGHISLNRPKAIHSLTHGDVRGDDRRAGGMARR